MAIQTKTSRRCQESGRYFGEPQSGAGCRGSAEPGRGTAGAWRHGGDDSAGEGKGANPGVLPAGNRFAFQSVAPGEYKVYAWEDVEPTAWMDAEFMKPFLSKGETVTVGESGRAQVGVRMIPADSEKEKR